MSRKKYEIPETTMGILSPWAADPKAEDGKRYVEHNGRAFIVSQYRRDVLWAIDEVHLLTGARMPEGYHHYAKNLNEARAVIEKECT